MRTTLGWFGSFRSGTEDLFSFNHGFDSIIHILDKILFRTSEPSLVWDIKDEVIGFGVLTVGASDLNIILVSDWLELSHIFSKVREMDVNWSSESGSKISWARCNITKVLCMSKFGFLFDLSTCAAQPAKDSTDVSSLLHADDSELVLFIDPHKESLFIVVIDTSAFRPVPVQTTCL